MCVFYASQIEYLETELDNQAQRYEQLEQRLLAEKQNTEKAIKEKEKTEGKHQAMANKFNKALRVGRLILAK